MNTDLTTAAVERLTAQLGEALFNQPGLDLIEIANRCNKMAARSGGALLPETPLTGRILTVDEFKAPSAPFKNKPEAVRLRDELRERAEFELWCEQRGYNRSPSQNNCGITVPERYAHPKVQIAWEAWQAALAATGKQQVGEVEREHDLLAEAIHKAAIKSGIYRADLEGMTGPQLLMACDDMAECIKAAQAVDLGQFREAVNAAWKASMVGSEVDLKLGKLLALIDGHLIDGQEVAEKPSDTSGRCANKKQPGGCHLSNLQCGYPACDKQSYSQAVQS